MKKAVKAAAAKTKAAKKSSTKKSAAKKTVKRKVAKVVPVPQSEEQASQDELPFLSRAD